jgi:type II secretory pathway component PulM
LLTWLAKQRDQYNIEVTQLSAQKTDTVGMADVVLVLQVK